MYNIYEDKVADTNMFSDYNLGHSYKLLVNGSALYFGTTPLPGGKVGRFRMFSALWFGFRVRLDGQCQRWTYSFREASLATLTSQGLFWLGEL